MKNAAKLKKLLQTLGDENRLRIIHCIGEGQPSVGQIVEATGLSQPWFRIISKFSKKT
jgi:DNA-binding transcriptional ArsR family regulator